MNDLGTRIRELREEMGIDARDFAKTVGLAYSSLMDLENGHSKSTKRLHKIIKQLSTTAEYLETGKGIRRASTARHVDDQHLSVGVTEAFLFAMSALPLGERKAAAALLTQLAETPNSMPMREALKAIISSARNTSPG